jgi:hypothetical protein
MNKISSASKLQADLLQIREEEKFRRNIIGIKKKTTIPAAQEEILTYILEKLEVETGSKYMMSIREIHTCESLEIKSFSQRDKYIISQMKTNYEELNGEYDSIIDIKKKLKELEYKNLISQPDDDFNHKKSNGTANKDQFRFLWVCPNCKYDKNHTYNEACQKDCGYTHASSWGQVFFNLEQGEIYISYGGAKSIKHPIGKLDMT